MYLLTRRAGIAALVALAALLLAGRLAAQSATFTVSGTQDNWTIDLTIDNTSSYYIANINLPWPMDSASVAPAGFDLDGANWLDDSIYGGSYGALHFAPNTTMSGFIATDTDYNAPTVVPLDLTLTDSAVDDAIGYRYDVNFNALPARQAAAPDTWNTLGLLAAALGVLALVGARKLQRDAVRAA